MLVPIGCGSRYSWILQNCLLRVQAKAMRVDIETCSSLSAGQTVCDMWGRSQLPKNATVALVGSLAWEEE